MVIVPAPYSPVGDVAVEVEVLHRVVFGPHREVVLARVDGIPFGTRPRREHAVVLEAEVPVQPRGVVLLDDEPPHAVGGPRLWPAPSSARRPGHRAARASP